MMSYRRTWTIIVSGFFEPLFYLLSLGTASAATSATSSIDGSADRVRGLRAPALLASSAFNGAFFDATNIFWKLRYQKTYDAMLATPIGPKDIAVGETACALFRGLIYAVVFFAVMPRSG